jgi:hypothetical protein
MLGVAHTIMKTRYVLLSLLVISTALFAALPPCFDSTKSPPILLPDAYQRATIALGSATNQFYCLKAEIDIESGPQGWLFTFTSANTPPQSKYVKVEFSGTTFVWDYRHVLQH